MQFAFGVLLVENGERLSVEQLSITALLGSVKFLTTETILMPKALVLCPNCDSSFAVARVNAGKK